MQQRIVAAVATGEPVPPSIAAISASGPGFATTVAQPTDEAKPPAVCEPYRQTT